MSRRAKDEEVASVQEGYNTSFYDDLLDGSMRSAAVIVPAVLDLVPVCSVLDVGCGGGAWLAEFARHGVDDFLGIDLDVQSPALVIDEQRFRRIDLNRPFDLSRRFDLVVCLEVAEHLIGDPAAFVESLCRHGDKVLFSAAIPGQGGTHHVNEQWLSYWDERFATQGYQVFDLLRAGLWRDRRVEWWYRQNIVLFATGESAVALRGTPPAASLIDVVHPEVWTGARREVGVREVLTEMLPYAATGALRRRLAASRVRLTRWTQ